MTENRQEKIGILARMTEEGLLEVFHMLHQRRIDEQALRSRELSIARCAMSLESRYGKDGQIESLMAIGSNLEKLVPDGKESIEGLCDALAVHIDLLRAAVQMYKDPCERNRKKVSRREKQARRARKEISPDIKAVLDVIASRAYALAGAGS